MGARSADNFVHVPAGFRPLAVPEAEGGEGAIDTPRTSHAPKTTCAALPDTRLLTLFVLVLTVAVAAVLLAPPPAYAGQSSTGKAAFRPCDRCHPVTVDSSGKPNKPLPNGFKKHDVTLEVHDTLGTDDKACLACHASPAQNPGKLILPDGSLVDIDGDVSKVCQRCHSEKYSDWKDGIHGKGAAKCSAAGCHDPHTPSWMYIEALPPFQGTGMEVRAVGERVAFKPLASPPPYAPVHTPFWLQIVTALGGLTVLGALGYVIFGGRTR